MNRYPHATKLCPTEEFSIEFATEPAPSWVKFRGWTVVGRIPGHGDKPARYLMTCNKCQHDSRLQRGRVHHLIARGHNVKCRECERRKKPPPTKSRWCRTCGNNPHRRDESGCVECGKPYGSEFYGAAPSSLVGGQLAGLAEVMDV